MATITKEQVLKLQAQAPEGWRFDWKYYVIHGEKTLIRLIKRDDTHYTEARIDYRENYKTITNSYGCRYNQRTGTNYISMNVSNWTVDANGTGHSYGLGHFENLDNGEHPRKNYKDLCKIAATVTDETIINYSGICKNDPFIL